MNNSASHWLVLIRPLLAGFDSTRDTTKYHSLIATIILGFQFCSSQAATTNDARFTTVDLSKAFNSSLTDSILYQTADSANHLRELPQGNQTLASIPFLVTGIVQLDGGHLHMLNKTFPKKVKGISVNQLGKSIHLLHGTGWKDGTGRLLSKMIVTYTDGSAQEFPIQYGVHVRDWWEFKEESVKDQNSTVAWRGTNPQAGEAKATIRLYKTTFSNPKPDLLIQSISFASACSMSCPFVVAITVEK